MLVLGHGRSCCCASVMTEKWLTETYFSIFTIIIHRQREIVEHLLALSTAQTYKQQLLEWCIELHTFSSVYSVCCMYMNIMYSYTKIQGGNCGKYLLCRKMIILTKLFVHLQILFASYKIEYRIMMVYQGVE